MRPRAALRGASASQRAFAGIFAVTALGLLAIGTTLPVLPKYVDGPMGGGDVAVGIVTGAFAVTGLLFRPIGGAFADARGRKPVVVVGALLAAISGLLLFVPAGIPGLIVSRLFLGAGEGMVYTAGSAWIVDMSPPERRGRIIGLYGLAIWGGLSVGPPLGDLLLNQFDYEAVWAFAALAPLVGAVIATRIPERYEPVHTDRPSALGARIKSLIAPESLWPGLGLALTIVGYATLASFIVLYLDDRGIGHGALVFTAFAVMVVSMRIFGGGIPDRYGGARSAAAAAAIASLGSLLISVAHVLPIAIAGAMLMGAGFALVFPSLALLVVNHVPEERRGAAMGTFTAFFDVGVGVGSPLAGATAALAGYGAAFALAGVIGLGTVVVALTVGRRIEGIPSLVAQALPDHESPPTPAPPAV
jgi:MFS family permease